MAIGAISDSHTADRHADSGRLHGIARLGVIALVALCAAAALWFVLPSAAFRTRALVAVTDIASPLSSVLPRAAADAAVSEPVMLRAAQSLIGTNVPVPAPDVMEQIAVVLGLGGAHATGQEARLAADLASAVTAKPGDVPGSVEVSGPLAGCGTRGASRDGRGRGTRRRSGRHDRPGAPQARYRCDRAR